MLRSFQPPRVSNLTLETNGIMAATLCPLSGGEISRLERPHTLPSSKNMDERNPTFPAAHVNWVCVISNHDQDARQRASGCATIYRHYSANAADAGQKHFSQQSSLLLRVLRVEGLRIVPCRCPSVWCLSISLPILFKRRDQTCDMTEQRATDDSLLLLLTGTAYNQYY